MRGATRKSSEKPEFNIKIWLRIREALAIMLGAWSFFLLLALSTYNSADPGWSHTTTLVVINNLGGKTGAYLADALLYLFGFVAYLFPALIFSATFFLFNADKKLDELNMHLWVVRIIGGILTIMAATPLVELNFTAAQNLPYGSGGAMGSFIAILVTKSFNVTGANLMLGALTLIGITLFSGFSWLKLMDNVGKLTQYTFSRYFPLLLARIKILLEKGYSSIKNKSYADVNFKISKKPKIQSLPTPSKVQAVSKERKKPIIGKALQQQLFTPKESKKDQSPKNNISTDLPDLDLLDLTPDDAKLGFSKSKLEHLSKLVEEKLLDFGLTAYVESVHPGPVITRFELTLAAGIKVSRLSGLAKDLARSLSVTSLRVVEVIPGKSTVGLEIPNENREVVRLRELVETQEFINSSPLHMVLGKDISGNQVIVNLAKMPHLLVAGTTGAGKSVSLNAMLLSILYRATPMDVRLILIDPKMLELAIYEGIPHLLTPVVTDMKDAANALRWSVAEMERRYKLMAALGVRNITGYNKKIKDAIAQKKPILDPTWDPHNPEPAPELEALPFVVVVIDELADMMMVVGKKVEELIARIAQKARAAGIHLILATQRPSVDVITGLIKANIPTRVAFQVSSRIDSRTILDQTGAEQLLGHGDMLYLPPGTGIPMRVHGAFVSDEEVHKVVEYWRANGKPDYIDSVTDENAFNQGNPDGEGELDELFDQALYIVTDSRKASISYLQRRLKVGYNRAARLMEQLEEQGVVSAMQASGGREVLAPPPS